MGSARRKGSLGSYLLSCLPPSASQCKEVRDRLATLTPREFDVLNGVIAGMLNKQIASQLGTTEGTIKVHRGRVMEKMGATSVAELVVLAQRAGIAPTSTHATKV